jgi:hypothetical protein
MKLLILLGLFAVDAATEFTVPPSQKLAAPGLVPPGAPPVLIPGKLHHRFGDLDLVLDDAGH